MPPHSRPLERVHVYPSIYCTRLAIAPCYLLSGAVAVPSQVAPSFRFPFIPLPATFTEHGAATSLTPRLDLEALKAVKAQVHDPRLPRGGMFLSVLFSPKFE